MITLCPDCAPGRAARTAIREDPELWTTLIAIGFPFMVVALVAAVLHRRGRTRPPRIHGSRKASRTSAR